MIFGRYTEFSIDVNLDLSRSVFVYLIKVSAKKNYINYNSIWDYLQAYVWKYICVNVDVCDSLDVCV